MPSGPAARAGAAVLSMLCVGIRQDAEVLAYMTAAHGGSEPGDFAAALADPDSPEARSLAALLLFPGPAQLAGLEPELEEAACSPADALEAARMVEAEGADVVALLPGGYRVPVPLEPGDLAALVARLRLDRALPPNVAEAACRHGPEGSPRIKAMLRHCRLEFTPGRAFFLAALIGAVDPAHPDLDEILSWSLSWLAALPPECDDPAGRLGDRHEELATLLRRSVDFHAAFAKSGYEAMMAQGARVSLPQPEQVRREMEVMDHVCRAVAGRPCWALARVARVDLGTVEDGESLVDVLGGI